MELISKYNDIFKRLVECPYCKSFHTRDEWTLRTSAYYNTSVLSLKEESSEYWYVCPSCSKLACAIRGLLYKNKTSMVLHPMHLYTNMHGHLGTVGRCTPYRNVHGQVLYIGDVVRVMSINISYVSEETIVVDDGSIIFIMGILDGCNPSTGETQGWNVRVTKPFYAIKPGDAYGGVLVREGTGW